MIKYLQRIAVVLLAAALICGTFSGCGEKNKKTGGIKAKSYDKANYGTDVPASGIIAKSDAFSMEWNAETKNVKFNDLKTGKAYVNVQGTSDEIRYDEDGIPIKNNPQIESAISVSFRDSTTLEEKTLYSYVGTNQNENISAELIENGIRVIYNFTDDKIIVPVDYTVKKDCFNISVDPAEICDDGVNFVTGVSPAPFICGVKNDSENSYLFIPDGSGAIIEPKTLSNSGKNGSMAVYGGDRAVKNFANVSYTEQCLLPVFGMKSGDSGLCAIIDSAAERSYINWNVGSESLKYSSVYPYFRIMGYNVIQQARGFARLAPETKIFNESLNPERLSVSYYPISGENCGYNDMAGIYRNYLEGKYGLAKKDNSDINLSIEIEGGIEEKKFLFGIPYTGLTTLTTVEQAQEMTEYFSDISDNMLVRLCGFTESGLDIGKTAGGFKINKKLGSKKDISALTDYCKKNNITLSLDFDTVFFNKGGNGYTTKKSSVLFSDYNINYGFTYDEVTRNQGSTKYFLISRSLVPDVLEKLSYQADKYGFEAVGVGTLGKTVYSDYANSKTYNCDNIQEDTLEELNKISENRKVVMTGANDYAACTGNYISDAPTSSSGYDVTAYDVPFYSMIFKGYVPMASGAVNLAADENTALLKCIEAGIAPTYTLIYDLPRSAVTSQYVVTRSSNYMSIRDNITKTAEKTKLVFKSVSGARISGHRVIDANVRAVSYDNGVTVYVNYGTEPVSVGGITVSAQGYAVTGGK